MRIGEHDIPPDRPVLIAGATASGKSALALEIAARDGGMVINADALQVYENWHVLTARPGPQDMARAPHCLFGHVARDQGYSVGAWLREVTPLLGDDARPIIVGGTGLYLTALTEGLAPIPQTPPAIRAEGDALRAAGACAAMIEDLDPATCALIDLGNPMRVQRAWEVQHTTGQGLAAWQEATPPPLLPLAGVTPLLLDAPKAWLNARIADRFETMLARGALDEARANLATWDPAQPSARAIGAAELIAHLQGRMTLAEARAAAITATRQFAKRQRTWFRRRMRAWHAIPPEKL